MITRGSINPKEVEEISKRKEEPQWMRKFRERSFQLFQRMKDPLWLEEPKEIDLDKLILYDERGIRAQSWEEIPPEIRRFYEEMNLPEQEKEFLAGLSTAYDAETVYTHAKEYLEKKGVILTSIEEAVKKFPELVKRYFGRVFPPAEHRYSALHYALWSGGTFLYVPDGVKVEFPIEAFFVIGEGGISQFEHSLIVVGRNASVHFIEGCSSPQFRKFSLHDGAVEMYVHEGGYLKFTTVQNWSKNVINFNNKRVIVEKDGRVEWVEGSFGSKISVVYPSVVLRENARARIMNFSIAHGGEWKEGGAKLFHIGKNSRSTVVSKSISVENGVSVFRGLLKVNKGAENAFSSISCDSLLMDEESKTFTYPHNQIEEERAMISYEATTSLLSEEQIFYLASRGYDEDTARAKIAVGFLSDIIRELPAEYAAVFDQVLKYDFKRGGVG